MVEGRQGQKGSGIYSDDDWDRHARVGPAGHDVVVPLAYASAPRRTLPSFAAVAAKRRSAGRLRNRSHCQHCKSDGDGGDERGDER